MCTGGDRVRRNGLRRLPVPAERVRTVQGELEEALNRLTGERTRVRLAGRTDAGVHATGQVVGILPRARAVAARGRMAGAATTAERHAAAGPGACGRSAPATAGFDPRRDARWRVYRYRIRTGGARHPLDRHRTLEIDERARRAAMQAAAARDARRTRLRGDGQPTRGAGRCGILPRCRSCGAETSSRSA